MGRPSYWTLALWGCLLVASRATLATAQNQPARNAPAEETPRAGSEEPVRELQPPVLYLKNKDGGLLQAVLGFTLEDFERLMTQRAERALGQQPPRFQLEQFTAEGRAIEGRAELAIDIRVHINDRGWVRVPLQLSQAVLRAKSRYEGSGEHVIEVDPQTEEYVLWLRGQSDHVHHVTLEVAVPLEKVGDQTELKLGFPGANVAELKLTVPEAEATAKVRAGGMLETSKSTANGTEFKILGVDGDFAMTWGKAATEAAEVPAPIEASGSIDTVVDGVGTHSDVQLTVRSFAPRLSSFRLRLPPGTTLAADEQAAYTLEPLAKDATDVDAREGRLYEVRLREKAAGLVVVHLSTDRPHSDDGGSRAFEIGGVELVGAARQWGHVAVRVADDWQIAWGALRHARQVESLPSELERPGVLSGFEYLEQPFAISGHVAPLASHVTVEPQYSIDVDARQARLQARLKYKVRGAKAFAVELGLEGWELDDVAPRSTFDVDRMVVEAARPLRIPLLQAMTGDIELVLNAHRDLPADATEVDFLLPRPIADSVAPTQVVVRAESNVALSPRAESLVGLTRARSEQSSAASGAHDRDMVFRGAAGPLRFVADIRVESQAQSANVHSRVSVDDREARVVETILFGIDNEPLNQLFLDAPTLLAESGRVQWLLDGESVSPTIVDGELDREQTTRLRIPLAEKRPGTCKLEALYSVDIGQLLPGVDSAIKVPLVMPAEANLSANELTLTFAPGILVRPRDEAWTAEPGAAPQREILHLSAAGAVPEIALEARLNDRESFDPTVVERAWYQTRLAGGERWDRAVYQFTSGDRRISLRLPPGAMAAEASVVLDAVALPPQIPERPQTLTVELPASSRRHVLDVSYRFASRAKEHGNIVLAAPELGDDVWVREMYWQLVLPRNEHLLDWPANMAGAFQWGYQGGSWGRQPLLDQPELEAWTGVAASPELPAPTNRYVLSGLGSTKSLDIYTASRASLVLFAAGGALIVGLSLLYFRALRRPDLLFALGIVLIAGAVLFPEPALLVAQASALGAGLVGMAVLLDRYIKSRRGVSLMVRSGSSSIVELGSTKTHGRPAAPAASAEPGALVPQATAAEGKS